MKSSRTVFFVITALVIAFAALSAYWWWSAQRLEAWITAWTQEQRSRGYEIAYQGPEVGGYPFRLTAHLQDPSMVSPEGWSWRGEVVSAQAFLWDPFTIEVDFAGLHRLQQDRGGLPRDLDASFGAAVATIHIGSDGSLQYGELDLQDATLHAEGSDQLSADDVKAQLGPIEKAHQGRPPAILIEAALSQVQLPPNARYPLGNQIERFAFDLLLRGRLSEGDPRAVIEAWRRSGGQLEINSLALEWGALGLLADGAIALDDQLRPQGAIDARIAGFAETLAALSGAGLIAPEQAVTLTLGLNAFAKEKDAQNRNVVVLPIELRMGRLYLGPLPLAALSPVL